jgi:AAA ATPase domain
VSNLWTLLDYDELASDIARSLRDSSDITVIEGPPGVGKSLLAKGIGELWEESGGSVAIAEGDSLRSDVALYPFGFALASLGSGWRSLGPAVAGIAKAGETLIGTAGIITATVQALGSARTAARKGRMLLLSDAEQRILVKLRRLAKRPPLLLIADNMHWWDSRSLELLGGLRNPHMREAFPFLDDIRILAVQTPQPYQALANPEAHEALLAPMETHTVTLPKIPAVGFGRVLEALGAPKPTAEQTADIYSFSGGNLALAQRCAARLAQGEDLSLMAEDSDQDFVRRLMGERIRSLGEMGRQAVTLLEVAAIVGLRFRRDELVCASDSDETETARLLRYCREEDMLQLEDGTGRFVHDVYRRHFLGSGYGDKIGIHERLADCFRQLRPGEYDLRCINAIDAEQVTDAATLGIQVALQAEREGRPWRELPERILDAIEVGDLGDVARTLVAAHHALRDYDYEACLDALDGLPHGLSKPLVAEATHLRAACLMSTRSEADREVARRILGGWSTYVNVEPELGTRLTLLSLYGLMHIVDKQPGIEMEEEIGRALVDRVSLDTTAKDALHTLDRCSGGLYQVDASLRRIRRAKKYFGPDDEDGLVRRPMEYYRCLVNLGSSLISNAKYNEACESHQTLTDFVEQYPDETFSRLDYPLMNQVLAEFRAGRIGSTEATSRQRQLLEMPAVENDSYYGANALAVYLTLSGQHDEAITILRDAEAHLIANRPEPEPNITYLLGSNLCLVRFVSGEREGAASNWEKVGGIIPDFVFPSKPVYARRHELLADVFRETRVMSALELDEVLLSKNRDELGPLWEDYAHGFMLPAIEMWREN